MKTIQHTLHSKIHGGQALMGECHYNVDLQLSQANDEELQAFAYSLYGLLGNTPEEFIDHLMTLRAMSTSSDPHFFCHLHWAMHNYNSSFENAEDF